MVSDVCSIRKCRTTFSCNSVINEYMCLNLKDIILLKLVLFYKERLNVKKKFENFEKLVKSQIVVCMHRNMKAIYFFYYFVIKCCIKLWILEKASLKYLFTWILIVSALTLYLYKGAKSMVSVWIYKISKVCNFFNRNVDTIPVIGILCLFCF